MSSTYPYRDAGPFTESGGELELDRTNLGYQPDGVFRRHTFQVVNLDGGTVDVFGRGPAGTWAELATGLGEDDVHHVTVGSWPAFRFVFTATGGDGTVYVRSVQDGL